MRPLDQPVSQDGNGAFTAYTTHQSHEGGGSKMGSDVRRLSPAITHRRNE